jgi:O-methyltransferase
VSLAPDPRDLYLDLLSDALAFLLWDEPGAPLDAVCLHARWHRRALVRGFARLGRSLGLRVYGAPDGTSEQRVQGKIWPTSALTMIGRKRLDSLRQCVTTVLEDGIEGDLLEAGAWRGGASILMRAVLKAHGVTDRRVFVADSFEGLPRPDPACHPHDRGDQHHKYQHLAVSIEDVRRNFERFGLLDNQVVFLRGWFKDTLARAPVDRLALLRLDGDMYGSTMDALEPLYPKLVPGGFCVIDDYALPGCRQAVDDYRARADVRAPLQTIDWTGVFWRKE